MKHTILGVLAAAMLLSLCACGGQTPTPERTKSPDEPAVTESGNAASHDSEPQKQEPAPEPTPEPYYPDVSSPSDLYMPEPRSKGAEDSLTELRDRMADAGADCAIAFLGYANPSMSVPEFLGSFELLEESKTAARYPFINEMTPANCVERVWSDLFCLVPRSAGIRIVIEEIAMDEDSEPTDEVLSVLYDSDSGEPVFFSSESNGWGGSNVRVRVAAADGSESEFFAAMWCNLGTVCEADGVLDFSIYGVLPGAE